MGLSGLEKYINLLSDYPFQAKAPTSKWSHKDLQILYVYRLLNRYIGTRVLDCTLGLSSPLTQKYLRIKLFKIQ